MENNQIVLQVLPVISHKLKEAGKSVQKRIDDLELDKQIATVDNIKAMKTLRADLNKEVKDFEEQRGAIKKAVNKPYNEFEDVYKEEITERYKIATDLLKNKIDFVEDKIKTEKLENVLEYFDELCISEKIDFLEFKQLGIEINLSTTEKKYKETVYDFIQKTIDDLSLIKTTDFEAEILTEYKKTLNVSQSITSVKTRKENEAIETARIKAQLISNRKKYLSDIGLVFEEITNSYEFNEDILISVEDIENLSKEDFTARYTKIEVDIKELKAKEVVAPSVEVLEKAKPTPIEAPVVEVLEEIKTASFEVKATMTKLRLLGQFMKSNGIIYKNI